ncbi:hypothetical protein [Streptomyces sp. YGL11-2]|uniref:hypothetical protein n=1 Tax=Streptomyces sp. YGL11-2 TaxID=3414028 RepID=UPI003CF66E78
MQTHLALSVIAIVVALASAALSVWGGLRSVKLQARIRQQQERMDLMKRFRNPLLLAAFDLQSRIYSLHRDQFIFFQNGTDAEKRYARHSTLFVLGEYLACIELVRRHVQFIEVGTTSESRTTLMKHLTQINEVLSDWRNHGKLFRVFRTEQRAIGEIMLTPTTGPEAAIPIGYAEFCSRLARDPNFSGWFAQLTDDLDRLVENPQEGTRFPALQHQLIDLINFLDPESERFPDWDRSKMPKESA